MLVYIALNPLVYANGPSELWELTDLQPRTRRVAVSPNDPCENILHLSDESHHR